tara:strand:+ start:289 stop:486 length:198 start_codon:yes stop_codon:yes gene_type:complete
MEVNEDSEGRSFIKADFTLKDIRQVYNAINFYLQNGNQEDDEYKNLLRIKTAFYSMMLESSFHSQ